MDEFKREMLKRVGKGGLKCYCCCGASRMHRGRNRNKRIHHQTRQRLKQVDYKLISEEITGIQNEDI